MNEWMNEGWGMKIDVLDKVWKFGITMCEIFLRYEKICAHWMTKKKWQLSNDRKEIGRFELTFKLKKLGPVWGQYSKKKKNYFFDSLDELKKLFHFFELCHWKKTRDFCKNYSGSKLYKLSSIAHSNILLKKKSFNKEENETICHQKILK